MDRARGLVLTEHGVGLVGDDRGLIRYGRENDEDGFRWNGNLERDHSRATLSAALLGYMVRHFIMLKNFRLPFDDVQRE